ncbi:MAG TPA: aldo/keto reductase [Candidatus Dormibacteraeota bacterium]|nr:aldo/keto reductase [Candidatus Dormibacteraeota bacterium]
MSTGATPEGTRRYAAKFSARAADGHFRELPAICGGLVLSSIGIGTYLGEPDARTDEAYTESVMVAVESGINVIDSAINYRFQRSERSVGQAVAALGTRGFPRDEIVVCTKAGYLTPDGTMPADPNDYFFREYIQKDVMRSKEIAAGSHCMTPRYLENQIARSLANLDLDCIDVFYLHNPETQLADIPREEFVARIHSAFEFLESAVAAGKIRFYGMATWNGFRVAKDAADGLQLAELDLIAQQIAGDSHHFRFVQVPYNLGMTEALTRPNQGVDDRELPMIEAAHALDIALIGSASLLQGQVGRNLPPFIAEVLGLQNDLQRALQFARSTPGITTALVGMRRAEHVRANAKLVGVAPTAVATFGKLFERGQSAQDSEVAE